MASNYVESLVETAVGAAVSPATFFQGNFTSAVGKGVVYTVTGPVQSRIANECFRRGIFAAIDAICADTPSARMYYAAGSASYLIGAASFGFSVMRYANHPTGRLFLLPAIAEGLASGGDYLTNMGSQDSPGRSISKAQGKRLGPSSFFP